MNKLRLLMFLLLAGVFLAACGSGNSEGAGDSDSGEAETLTIWSYDNEADYEFIQKWISTFESNNQNVEVNWVYVEIDQFIPKLLGSGLSKDLPDAIFYAPLTSATLYDAGILADLSEFWDQYADKDQFPEYAQWRYDEKLLSVQGYADTLLVWYNKKILNDLGIEPPTTMSQFDAALEAADKAGYTPFTTWCSSGAAGEAAVMPWMHSYGVSYADWAQGPTAEVFRNFKEWTAAGYLPRDCVNWSLGDSFEQFLKGDVAFSYNGSWMFSEMGDDPPFEYGVMPVPAGPGGSHSIMGGEGYAITTAAKNPELAWKFWEETGLSRDGQEAALESDGLLPTREDLKDAEFIQSRPALGSFVEIRDDAFQRPLTTRNSEAREIISSIYSSVVAGELTPEQAAEKLRDETAFMREGSE